VEGALILVVALIIAVEAIPRLLHPQPLEQVGLGLAFSVLGALINGVLAWFMLRLDPIIALLVAVNIIWTGIRLLHQTGLGPLDTALPEEDLEQINTIVEIYRAQGLVFHACALGKLALVATSPSMCLSPVPGL
jgi:divalent metal cation (Fe/Co/Zn/Cd) transporter